jgi:FkbM family methyltransferase
MDFAALQYRMRSALPQPLRHALSWARDRVNGRPLPGKVRLGQGEIWHLYLPALDAPSVVYSAGAGRDVTFELELAARVGCTVHLFDPSPTGRATMEAPENRHPLIEFEPIGLAGTTGRFGFAPPLDDAEGSFYVDAAASDPDTTLYCEDLTTIMARLGHTRIDLLKMDIEGAEYDVIEHIRARAIPIGQLCVEFHPFMGETHFRRTHEALEALRGLGYRVIHRRRHDYTLLLDARS